MDRAQMSPHSLAGLEIRMPATLFRTPVRPIVARIGSYQLAELLLQVVVSKVPEEIKFCEVTIVAQLALGKSFVVKLVVAFCLYNRHVCRSIGRCRGRREMSVFWNSFLFQCGSVFLFDNEVHVDHQGGRVFFEKFSHNIVLQAVVEQKGYSRATDERTSGTLKWLVFRQILKNN